MENVTYHGWIVVESGGPGFKDYFSAEWTDAEGNRQKVNGHKVAGQWENWRNPTDAIEFWDKKVGQPVFLLKTPLGAYRVYTKNKSA